MIKQAWAIGLMTLCLGTQAQAQAALGQNLIVNGDAESGVAGWTGFDGYDLFQSVDYGSNWVLPTQPGPADRGAKMFAGLNARAAGYQLLELGELSQQSLAYDLSGWLGGWTTQTDNAMLYVSFLDASSAEIGSAALGPLMPADRNNTTGLFLMQAHGLLPTGTSSLMFSMSMERFNGGDNDGYADNLSFTLSAAPVPEAQSLAYALVGLSLVGGLLGQRRRG